MKGVINKGIQEFALARFGPETWERIKSLARCEEPFFAASHDYPDAMTLALVQAAAEVTGLPTEMVEIEYGKFMVPNTLKETYPTYFTLAGRDARTFLRNMDGIHREATRRIANATPPRLECETLGEKRLLVHYSSPRKLCGVLRGLILGVGIHFGQELQLRALSCMRSGDPRCTIEVTFP